MPDRRLVDGPGKLCQGLGIAAALNGIDLTESAELCIETGERVDDREVITARASACAGMRRREVDSGGLYGMRLAGGSSPSNGCVMRDA